MATVSITCMINYDQESGIRNVSFSPANSISNPLKVVKGDSVQFTVLQLGDATGYSFVIYGFDPGYWTDTTNSPVMNPGGVLTRTTNASASVGSGHLDQLTLDAYGSVSLYTPFWIEIGDGADSTPNPFSIGPDIVGAKLGGQYYSADVTITGINVGSYASVNSGCSLQVNGAFVSSPYLVYAGDVLTVGRNADNLYNSTSTMTLTVGGVSDSATITTMNDPESGQIIPFPYTSVPVSLNNIIQFYGGYNGVVVWDPAPRNLTAYLKGGPYVPNITKNANIPTSVPINISQFLGSGTTFFLLYGSPTKSSSNSTINGAVNAEISWGAGVDYDVGYGPGMKWNVEYRYILEEYPSDGLNLYTGATLSREQNVWTTASAITIYASAPYYTERFYNGRIRVDLRLIWDTSKIITLYLYYSLRFFGP